MKRPNPCALDELIGGLNKAEETKEPIKDYPELTSMQSKRV